MGRHRPARAPAIHAFNVAGALLRGAGVRFGRMEADALIEQARRETGLEDFGDPGIEEGLGVLLEALENEARLHAVGRIAARRDVVHLLKNRLRLEADRQRWPGIARQQIRAPLFIVGMPRSGTTLLHGLLGQDPVCRVPRAWEVMHPSPPPAPHARGVDPRIARAEREMRWLDRLAPDFRVVHTVGAMQPQECIAITSHTFASARFHTTYWVPGYQAWLCRQDPGPVYAYHRRFLQHLHWRGDGERWVLKAPAHLFGLEALFRTYPDAAVVHTHRDPVQALASVASLSAVLQGAFSDRVDLPAIGQEVAERWHAGVERAWQVRERLAGLRERFFDVHYRDLAHDPMAVVRGVYAHFGWRLSEEARERMRHFLASNPKGKHGRHRYSLRTFGLDPERESRRFEAYRAHFGIEPEPVG